MTDPKELVEQLYQARLKQHKAKTTFAKLTDDLASAKAVAYLNYLGEGESGHYKVLHHVALDEDVSAARQAFREAEAALNLASVEVDRLADVVCLAKVDFGRDNDVFLAPVVDELPEAGKTPTSD